MIKQVDFLDIIMEVNFNGKEKTSDKCFELAKKMSIEFAKWISKHPLSFQTARKDEWIGVDMEYYTTEELLNTYLTEQK